MIFNNCTQYLLSLIIIISTWEPVMPLYLSLEQKPRSMGRESAVSASPLGFARSQWSRRHLGSEQGRLLEAFYVFWTWGAFPVILQRSCSLGVPVPRPAQPPALPLAAHVAFRTFVFCCTDTQSRPSFHNVLICVNYTGQSPCLLLLHWWIFDLLLFSLCLDLHACVGFFSPLKK